MTPKCKYYILSHTTNRVHVLEGTRTCYNRNVDSYKKNSKNVVILKYWWISFYAISFCGTSLLRDLKIYTTY